MNRCFSESESRRNIIYKLLVIYIHQRLTRIMLTRIAKLTLRMIDLDNQKRYPSKPLVSKNIFEKFSNNDSINCFLPAKQLSQTIFLLPVPPLGFLWLDLVKKCLQDWFYRQFKADFRRNIKLSLINQGLSRCFCTSKMLLNCPILFLVPMNGKLLPWNCPELHFCLNRLHKHTQFFSKQPCRFRLSWSQPLEFYLQSITQW